MSTIDQPRSIRVFVSSTFRDMQAERDYLVKFTFPQLRKLCEQRGVGWGEVDLRWGITDEQQAEGQVLPICLDEIRHCRPYFIGLLGERYGWIPTAISPDLLGQEPWLSQHAGHSVTELEVLHGVLNNPEMAEHAFFYFRDPQYAETLPAGERADFEDHPSQEEIARLGLQAALADRRRKLDALKQRIRASGFPTRENFCQPRQLGDWVLQDLAAVIERLYPEGSQPDPLDREAAAHQAFASSRARVYIGRQACFDRLDQHALSVDQALVLKGQSGGGKSALLANWAARYAGEHPDHVVIQHFIGATPDSTQWTAMLLRIMGELKRRLGFSGELPSQPDDIRSAFPGWLRQAAGRSRIILVVDALNQLEDRDNAPGLGWLPEDLPPNLRLYLSTLPGRAQDELERRGWPSLAIEPLSPGERQQLILEYLALFSKTLTASQVGRIASAPQCGNPLFLRLVLDELRLFGVYEQLDQRLDSYLRAPDSPGLYEMILERCEQDYERDRPGLVGDALSFLWAARRGLAESELLDLLGSSGSPMPHAFWAPLHIALEESLVDRLGLLAFNHDFLQQAVIRRYLPDSGRQQGCRLQLAAYFESQPLSPRQAQELPWLLAQAEQWERLAALLKDVSFLPEAWHLDPYDVRRYWQQIESHSRLRMIGTYKDFESEQLPILYLDILSQLFSESLHVKQSLEIRQTITSYWREHQVPEMLSGSLSRLAELVQRQGDLSQALRLHEEEEQICRQLGDRHALAFSLGNQAGIHYEQGSLEEALHLGEQALALCRELGAAGQEGLGYVLNVYAGILRSLGRGDEAMRLLQEAETVNREIGHLPRYSAALGNQGKILLEQERHDQALERFKKQYQVSLEIGDQMGILDSLQNQGNLMLVLGRNDESLEFYKAAERIARQARMMDNLAGTLALQAGALSQRGDLEPAIQLMREAAGLFHDIGDRSREASSLGIQARLLLQASRPQQALPLLQQARQIHQDLGQKKEAASLGSLQAQVHRSLGEFDLARQCAPAAEGPRPVYEQALDLFQTGRFEPAMALLEPLLQSSAGLEPGLLESVLALHARLCRARGDLPGALSASAQHLDLCRQLANPELLSAALGFQASLCRQAGDPARALALFQEQQPLLETLGDRQVLHSNFSNQALVLMESGRRQQALELYSTLEQMCRKEGDRQGLMIALGNRGILLDQLDQLEPAMLCYREQEQLCRELDDQHGLQACLGNQGLIFMRQGDLNSALDLMHQQEQMARQSDDADGLATSLINQALVLANKGRFSVALTFAGDALQLARKHGLAGLASQIQALIDDIQRETDGSRAGSRSR